jgi:hypothetical protein
LKIKLDLDDTDLTKKKEENRSRNGFFGRWHKFHNIREFFKKEKGGFSLMTLQFFYFMANMLIKSSLEPHMKLASDVVDG